MAGEPNARFRNAEVVGDVGVRARFGGGARDERGGRGVETRVALGSLRAGRGQRGMTKRHGEMKREKRGGEERRIVSVIGGRISEGERQVRKSMVVERGDVIYCRYYV